MWTALSQGNVTAVAATTAETGQLERVPATAFELFDCAPGAAGLAGNWCGMSAPSLYAPLPEQSASHAAAGAKTIDVLDAPARKPGLTHDDAASFRLSFNVGVVSADIRTRSGWNAGVRSSTIAERGGSEVALYGAKVFEVGETELTLGATALIFPGEHEDDFGSVQASASRAIGPIDVTVAVNYAWEQSNLEHEDNLYVGLRARTPIGRLFDVPVTLGASVGRAEGHFAIAESKVDWSLSLTGRVGGFDIGVSYVDTDLDDRRGSPTAVLSITHTF
jgi:uncharacterized protein (TIGR02001 family)